MITEFEARMAASTVAHARAVLLGFCEHTVKQVCREMKRQDAIEYQHLALNDMRDKICAEIRRAANNDPREN